MKLFLYFLISLILVSVVHSQNSRTLKSPKIISLEAALASGKTDAVQKFWADVKKDTTPLIEAIEGDAASSLVTFVWRGDDKTNNVLVQSPFFLWNMGRRQMQHISGTDVWYKTEIVANDIRVNYQFSVNDPRLAALDPLDWFTFKVPLLNDPLNPRRFVYAKDEDLPGDVEGEMSQLLMPGSFKSPYVTYNRDIKHGELVKTHFKSKILPDERRVWFYAPPDYSAKKKYPLVIFFDGWDYLNHIPGQTILDNLIAAGKIEPVVAVFVATPIPAGVREKEYYANPKFAELVMDELLPLIHSKYSVFTSANKTTIVGLSASGFAGAFIALKHPDKVGNVIMQSPAVWWGIDQVENGNWLTEQFVEAPVKKIRFYVEIGKLESRTATVRGGPVPVYSVRHFRDVLKLKGYRFTYSEFNGAHDYINWRETLPKALTIMLGK